VVPDTGWGGAVLVAVDFRVGDGGAVPSNTGAWSVVSAINNRITPVAPPAVMTFSSGASGAVAPVRNVTVRVRCALLFVGGGGVGSSDVRWTCALSR
jgi:hypothetical protein